jgi:hypothetical protein
MGLYTFSRVRFNGFRASELILPFRKKEIKTGARVTVRMASSASINVFVQASGPYRRFL